MKGYKIILKNYQQDEIKSYYTDQLPNIMDMIGLMDGDKCFIVTHRLVHPEHYSVVCFGEVSTVSEALKMWEIIN